MSKPIQPRTVYALVALLVIALIATGYLLFAYRTVAESLAQATSEQAQTTNELASTSSALENAQTKIADLHEELDEVTEELEEAEDDLRDERNRNEDFEDQIGDLAGTVGDLDKLSKTDEELLQKYSKVYFLNENYIPSDIEEIDEDYIFPEKVPQYFHGDALPFLEDMIEAAEDDGVELKIVSAYRSFDHQQQLKGEYTQTYGSGANAFSADQGYSEHQLGTTVDFADPETGLLEESFAETEAYEWLLDNAHEYGFTLSYPEDNNFYLFEPWHWRFVGVELAEDLERANDHFYDWEQREIDQYLINIFDE